MQSQNQIKNSKFSPDGGSIGINKHISVNNKKMKT